MICLFSTLKAAKYWTISKTEFVHTKFVFRFFWEANFRETVLVLNDELQLFKNAGNSVMPYFSFIPRWE